MTKAIATVMAVGLVMGIVGGVIQGEPWLGLGGVLLVGGVIALYVLGIWKNPLGVAKAEMEVEEMSLGYPPKSAVEQHSPSNETTQGPPKPKSKR
jgi:hypothetical protein